MVNLIRVTTTILTSRNQTDSFISFSFLSLLEPCKILGAILRRREKADSRAYFLLVVRTTSLPIPRIRGNEIPPLVSPVGFQMKIIGFVMPFPLIFHCMSKLLWKSAWFIQTIRLHQHSDLDHHSVYLEFPHRVIISDLDSQLHSYCVSGILATVLELFWTPVIWRVCRPYTVSSQICRR